MALCSNEQSNEPPQKKAKLSLKLKRKREPLQEVRNYSRFASPIKDSNYNEVAKGIVSANTKKSTDWAVRVFESWVNERSVKSQKTPFQRIF